MSTKEILEELKDFLKWFTFKDAKKITIGDLLNRFLGTIIILLVSWILVPGLLAFFIIELWRYTMSYAVWKRKGGEQ